MQFYDFTKSSYCLKEVPCNVLVQMHFFNKVQWAETIFEIVSIYLLYHDHEMFLKFLKCYDNIS